MTEYTTQMAPARRLAAALTAIAIGVFSMTRPADAAFLFFGDDVAAPHGDFQLVSGELSGPNYYNNAAKAGGAIPAAADTLFLGNAATVSHSAGALAVTSIRVAASPGDNPTDGGNTIISYPKSGTLEVTGGTVTTSPGPLSFSIGDGNTGAATISGSANVTAGGRIQVGVAGPGATPGSTGSLSVAGDAAISTNGIDGIWVGGQVMTGQLELSDNGQILVPNGAFRVGTQAADGNSVTVNGGALTVNGGVLTIGAFGGANPSTGNVFTQNDGAVNANHLNTFGESIIIAGPAGTEASYALNNGTLNVAGTAQVGNFGAGAFTAVGGAADFGEVNVANFNSSTGLFEVVGPGAAISVANRFTVSTGDDSLAADPNAIGGLGTLRFETDALGALSIIDVDGPSGVAILGDAAVVELDLAGSSPMPFYNLLTALDITADLNAISFAGPAGYALQIVPGLRGEILQAVIPEPASLVLGLSACALLALRRNRG